MIIAQHNFIEIHDYELSIRATQCIHHYNYILSACMIDKTYILHIYLHTVCMLGVICLILHSYSKPSYEAVIHSWLAIASMK